MAEIRELTTDTFEATAGEETLLLVDFWAEWCAPCRAIAPILKEVAQEQGERLSIMKLNVDDHPDVARRLGVLSIPTLILFAKGEEKKRFVGLRSKDQLVKELEPHFA